MRRILALEIFKKMSGLKLGDVTRANVTKAGQQLEAIRVYLPGLHSIRDPKEIIWLDENALPKTRKAILEDHPFVGIEHGVESSPKIGKALADAASHADQYNKASKAARDKISHITSQDKHYVDVFSFENTELPDYILNAAKKAAKQK